jgi:hypothetical protein
MKMRLSDYLAGIRSANTADELESAIQAPYKHSFSGPTWSRICKERLARALAIIAAHPKGRFAPQLDRRKLTVCGEVYRVGRGYNSTGVSYVWHSAKVFSTDVLERNGLSKRAAHRIWESWEGGYPHRCLKIIEEALSGKITDPPLNILILVYDEGLPITYSVEVNETDDIDKRATRPCPCGGTLFDWGSSFSEGFEFISWHCCKCPCVYTEYMTLACLTDIRQNPRDLSQEKV